MDNIDNDSIDGNNSISTIRHKIVFIGDVSVGKSSIITRFIEGKFKETYDVIIILNFRLQLVLIFVPKL